MRAPFQSFFSFSRSERLGLVALLGLVFICSIVSLIIPLVVHPDTRAEDAAFAKAWQQWLAQQQPETQQDRATITAAAVLFSFDPNTADSTTLLQLGLNSKTTHMLLNWRRKGKVFRNKEDLRALYTLRAEDYERLAPFINIKQTNPEIPFDHNKYAEASPLPPLPEHIDLNHCDSALLVRIKGIGSTLAHRIIERRNTLGGFIMHSQLMEVYKFPDTTFAYLQQLFTINPADIHKIDLNKATLEQLSTHPYIGLQMAQNILQLRTGLSKYEKTAQLRQVPLMNEEKYRKIAPYCTTE